MKWFVGLAALAASTNALAYPIDIENHARWLVLDSLPTYTNGRTVSANIANLRTNDLIPSGQTPISAVCGTVDSATATTAYPISSSTTAWTTTGRPSRSAVRTSTDRRAAGKRSSCATPRPSSSAVNQGSFPRRRLWPLADGG